MKISILGLGARGMTYAHIARDTGHVIEAVCDVNEERVKDAMTMLDVRPEMAFLDAEEFFKQGKIGDVLIISTLDATHYEYTMRALSLGYDILLEKPIAITLEHINAIAAEAKRLNRKIGVCHVLRYTPFYMKMKEIIDSGVIGKVMNINHTENVGYLNYTHAYVRGNWSQAGVCPMILAKCCHDFDILVWLTGKHCNELSSFGSLDYFKEENAPEGSTKRCKDCQARESCPYDGYKMYSRFPTWVRQPNGCDFTVENAMKVLEDNATFYDKCVYRSGNNVVDHQMVNMVFEGGTLVNLTMQGFAGRGYRRTQVCGSLGEIHGVLEDKKLEVHIYGEDKPHVIELNYEDKLSLHSGGDRGLFLDFIRSVEDENASCRTSIEMSVESHRIAFAAEESRVRGGEVVKVK